MKIVLIIAMVLCWGISPAQVGINTSNPLSTLDINGNLSVKTIGLPVPLNGGGSGHATPIDDGVYISLTPSVGAPEFLLPDPVSVPGRIYILRNISDSVTAVLYIAGPRRFFPKNANAGSGLYGPVYMPPNSTGKTMILISDGANWTYFD
jgi:hypothetical protein